MFYYCMMHKFKSKVSSKEIAKLRNNGGCMRFSFEISGGNIVDEKVLNNKVTFSPMAISTEGILFVGRNSSPFASPLDFAEEKIIREISGSYASAMSSFIEKHKLKSLQQEMEGSVAIALNHMPLREFIKMRTTSNILPALDILNPLLPEDISSWYILKETDYTYEDISTEKENIFSSLRKIKKGHLSDEMYANIMENTKEIITNGQENIAPIILNIADRRTSVQCAETFAQAVLLSNSATAKKREKLCKEISEFDIKATGKDSKLGDTKSKNIGYINLPVLISATSGGKDLYEAIMEISSSFKTVIFECSLDLMLHMNILMGEKKSAVVNATILYAIERLENTAVIFSFFRTEHLDKTLSPEGIEYLNSYYGGKTKDVKMATNAIHGIPEIISKCTEGKYLSDIKRNPNGIPIMDILKSMNLPNMEGPLSDDSRGQIMKSLFSSILDSIGDLLSGINSEAMKDGNLEKEFDEDEDDDDEETEDREEKESSSSGKDSKKDKVPASDQLEKMIGLKNVKTLIKDVISKAVYEKEFDGKNGGKHSQMHMAFMGNPGTAKTTVARLFSEILYEKGITKKPIFIEASRSSIIGKYVGHTAPRVVELFEKAKGGVLFIDEAYALDDGSHRKSFGDEAIATLIKEMEDNREDTIVILAGYTKPMQELLESNPGFKSRIKFNVEFPDYSVDELMEIMKLFSDQEKAVISDEAGEEIKKLLAKQVSALNKQTTSLFGNGRYVRNIYENLSLLKARRVVDGLAEKKSSLPEEDYFKWAKKIEAEDVKALQTCGYIDISPSKRSQIGFSIKEDEPVTITLEATKNK